LVKKHKIPFHEKTLGQLFCDNKSRDILNMLLAECENSNANIKLNTKVENIENPHNNYFKVKTNNGEYHTESLVVATGGLSIPTMGASAFGYKIAEQFGLKVYPTRAGLVPFTLQLFDKEKLAKLSGVAVPSLIENKGVRFNEAILFSHRGLSGPAVLQISSYWSNGDKIKIDLLPNIDIYKKLELLKQKSPTKILKNVLSDFLPKSLIEIFIPLEILNRKLGSASKEEFEKISSLLNKWTIKPSGTEGYRTAEVTLGGLDTNVLSSKTFEVNSIPGLYFIGEVVDVTGWLGGYNFQWAWSSGWAAGQVV